MLKSNKNTEIEMDNELNNLITLLEKSKSEFKRIKEKYVKEEMSYNSRQQDILHYIEFKKLSSVAGFRLVKELQNVRQKRRIIKDKLELLERLEKNFSIFPKSIAIKSIINSQNQHLNDRNYHTRYYTETTLNNIVNNKGGNNNEVC